MYRQPFLGNDSSSVGFHMADYEIRLMFEWGGSCLWGMNAAAKDRYGYCEIESVLPLSEELKSRLAKLSQIHDKKLNWDDPTGPSPWSEAESANFEMQAQAALDDVRTELGDRFYFWYDPL